MKEFNDINKNLGSKKREKELMDKADRRLAEIFYMQI